LRLHLGTAGLAAHDLGFGLEPIVHIVAGLAAALLKQPVGPQADDLFGQFEGTYVSVL
jgi:hypothetical protein